MGIEKTKLLAHECVYWHSINADIEKYIKQCATCLEFQQMQLKEKIIHHEIPLRPWEAVGGDVFHFNNINYLCVVDYNSKFESSGNYKDYWQNTSLMQYHLYLPNMVYHEN